MNPDEIEIYEVITDDEAEDNIKRLVRKKKFYSLPSQIKEVIANCEKGKFEGDNILTYEEPTRIEVYKMRLPNPDVNVGKSNGYRVVYVIAVEHKLVVILTVYYKKEVPNLSDSTIRNLINSFIKKYIIEQLDTEDKVNGE